VPSRALLLLMLSIAPAAEQGGDARLGELEFFGHKGLDVDAVRSALPLREGDRFEPSAGLKRVIAERVVEVIGRGPTDVNFVCCDERQAWMVYVGLPGSSTTPVVYRPTPAGDTRFPPEIVRLRDELDDATMTAVMSGHGSEDDSQGYSLSSEPALRSKQMALRAYALRSERLIIDVLDRSSDTRHRAIAAEALGYARTSDRQIAALVHACLDSNDGVRNDAVRALAVLARAKAAVARRIPAAAVIPLVASGIWTDRNKGIMLLDALTERRDPRLLRQLRDSALDSLIEMARWRSRGHAESARVVLGRIAGIAEPRLRQLVQDDQPEAIISAVTSRRD